MASELDPGLVGQIIHTATKSMADYLYERGQNGHPYDEYAPMIQHHMLEQHLIIWQPVLTLIADAFEEASKDESTELAVLQLRISMLIEELKGSEDVGDRNMAGRLELLIDGEEKEV